MGVRSTNPAARPSSGCGSAACAWSKAICLSNCVPAAWACAMSPACRSIIDRVGSSRRAVSCGAGVAAACSGVGISPVGVRYSSMADVSSSTDPASSLAAAAALAASGASRRSCSATLWRWRDASPPPNAAPNAPPVTPPTTKPAAAASPAPSKISCEGSMRRMATFWLICSSVLCGASVAPSIKNPLPTRGSSEPPSPTRPPRYLPPAAEIRPVVTPLVTPD